MRTIYSDELAETICAHVIEGRSLRAIAALKGLPDKATIMRWLAKHDAFRDQYARAREMQAEFFAEEILAIAEDVPAERDAINRARLQIDVRKWLMSKMAPKKYGNRQTLAGDPDAPLRIDVSKMTDLQLEAALKLFAMTSNATRVPARKAETN